MLHVVNKSPFLHNNLQSCLRIAEQEDPIMLIEDAVYAVAVGTSLEPMMREALKRHPIYAIRADLKARGIHQVLEGVNICDYSCFVDLAEHHQVFSWL